MKINGCPATLGQKADPEHDRIEVDGKVLEDRAQMLYYVMNKPIGLEMRSVVPDELQNKVFPVGRLDKDTSGLLILTNDGVLAYRLTHPKFYHEKEYEVKTEQPITDGALKKMQNGLKILGKITKPATIKRISARRFTISITEGRNRQIRRMCQKIGSTIKELKRIRIVTLRDDRLEEGEIRKLSESEIKNILKEIED